MLLSIGDIVTVTLEECTYFEKQGQVVEIVADGDSDGPIGVKFGRWCEVIAFNEEHITVRFEEPELRKDLDWSLEVKVFQCYGDDLWHSLYALKYLFDPAGTCKAEGCQEPNVRRCLINIWGSVYEIDLCKTCATAYHGMMGESFPRKAAVAIVA
jgi:hypothetical protein